MDNLCEYCNSSFKNKYALLYHQRSAKYCLKIQGVENTNYICSYCNKNLSDKRMLESHEEKCCISDKVKDFQYNSMITEFEKQKELISTLERKHQDMIISFEKKILLLEQENKYYKETIAELKSQNSQFQSKLENIAVQGVNKPTTTNNIIKIQNLTDEWLKESSNNLTLEYIEKGPLGYAEFASRHSLRNRVKCVDFARKILQYKEDDAIIRDKKGKKLSKKFFESIESKNNDLISVAVGSIREEMEHKTPEELDVLIEKMNKFLDMKTIDIANNKDLKEDFVKELCDLL
jgi:hypothetical protein